MALAALTEPRRALRPYLVSGLLIGGVTAASPLALWWLNTATVYAMAVVLIAAVYIGFAVADGRRKVLAVEISVRVRRRRCRRCDRTSVVARGRPTRAWPHASTGATGLEPATSGVTGRSWRLRAERGQAGICGVSRASRAWSCGIAGYRRELPAIPCGISAG